MTEQEVLIKENKQKPLNPVLAVIIAILLVGSAVYVWQRQNRNLLTARKEAADLMGQVAALQKQLEARKPPSEVEEAASPKAQTAGFLNYEDKARGFEFSYPEGYKVETQGEGIVIKSDEKQEQYKVVFLRNTLKLSLTELVALDLLKQNRGPEALTLASQTEIEINGVKGIDTELSGKNRGKIRNVYLPDKFNNFVNIQYSLAGQDETFLKNGDQLIRSYKLGP